MSDGVLVKIRTEPLLDISLEACHYMLLGFRFLLNFNMYYWVHTSPLPCCTQDQSSSSSHTENRKPITFMTHCNSITRQHSSEVTRRNPLNLYSQKSTSTCDKSRDEPRRVFSSSVSSNRIAILEIPSKIVFIYYILVKNIRFCDFSQESHSQENQCLSL
jgi:hypothetical protein